MPLTLNEEKGLIFRITHRDNIPWILDHGLHAKNGVMTDPNFRTIGNPELIDRRANRQVPVPPLGTLSDYIPFYFTPYSIMLFNIRTGYGGVQKVPNEEIVMFVSSVPHLQEHNIPFIFTDQHAYPAMAGYYTDTSDLKVIDWQILQRRDFKHDPDDPGKKERYQAEALVWKHLPVHGLLGVCCYSNETAGAVLREVKTRELALKVGVQASWYF